MSSLFYSVYAVLYLFVLAWGGRLWRRVRQLSTAIFLAVTFGVFYDNLIFALGNLFRPGDQLDTLRSIQRQKSARQVRKVFDVF